MSQGAMEDEGHTYYDTYFGIPASGGGPPLYRYAQVLDIEDFDSPEPNDRSENIDVAADRRVGWADRTQETGQTQEEEEWDYCIVEPDGCEDYEGRLTAQRHYQAGAASWFPSLSRH